MTTSFQVKLNLSLLEDISDDMDFCVKLAKEESVVVLPGNQELWKVIRIIVIFLKCTAFITLPSCGFSCRPFIRPLGFLEKN